MSLKNKIKKLIKESLLSKLSEIERVHGPDVTKRRGEVTDEAAPTDATIKTNMSQYSVSDDPYDVAVELGKKYNWNQSQIEKAEKLIRKKYIKEARRGSIYKAAKQGSYPVTIVVVEKGKVVKQELVGTSEIVPAAFNVLQSEYPKAVIHIEDRTGKRLFSESVNEAMDGPINESSKYLTDKFKVGDQIDLLKYNWTVVEINFKPGKQYKDSFTFVDGKQVNIPNPPPTNRNAIGYKLEDGSDTAFYYCYKGMGGRTIMKLAVKGFNESVNEDLSRKLNNELGGIRGTFAKEDIKADDAEFYDVKPGKYIKYYIEDVKNSTILKVKRIAKANGLKFAKDLDDMLLFTESVNEAKVKVPKTIKSTSDLEKYFYGLDLKKAKEVWGKSFGYHLTAADEKSYFVTYDGKKRVIKLTDLKESVNESTADAYALHRLANNVGEGPASEFLSNNKVDLKLLAKAISQKTIDRYALRDIVNGKAHKLEVKKFMDKFVNETVINEAADIKDIHFEMDPKKQESMKLELGARFGGVTTKEKLNDANYELKRFRKKIKYWDGNKRDEKWALGPFAGPEHYNTVKSTLGAGPHAKKITPVKWNQKKYDKWVKDMASGGGWKHSYDMAQNATMERGLIDWVKKNKTNREDPLERIQWDIEALGESVVNEAKDNLYLQLHKKYAYQMQNLKTKKIKKLTDLVSVQRWSMEDRDDYFTMKPADKKKMSGVFDNERKLFKQYIAGDHSVMLPRGTETLTEALSQQDVFKMLKKLKPSLDKVTQNFSSASSRSKNSVYDALVTRAEKLPTSGTDSAKDILTTAKNIIKLWKSKINEGVMSELDILAKEAKDLKAFIKAAGVMLGDKIDKDTAKWLALIYKTAVTESVNEQVLTEGVNDPNILKAVFLAGGPGSGKSFTAEQVFGIDNIMKGTSSLGLKIVNSDPAFENELKKRGVDPKNLAQMTDKVFAYYTSAKPDSARGKAKKLKTKLERMYHDGRLGLIIDGTGHDFGKVAKKKQRLEQLGYDTSMLFVNTSLAVAQTRNKSRERTLPEDLLEKMWQDVQNNMGKFQTLFGNNFHILDNSEIGDFNKMHKNKISAVTKLVKKPVKNPIGKQWIEDEKKLRSLA